MRTLTPLAPHRTRSRFHAKSGQPSRLLGRDGRRNRLRFDWLEGRTLLTSFVVSSTNDSGPGSLRQAILDSNADTSGVNTIDFTIPGSGVQTIAPLSALPAITNPVLIDGWSQQGYTSTPLIELSGSQSTGVDGLMITGPDITVRGLDINGFSQDAGIHITGTSATGDWIYGNFLGTDPTGTQAEPNYNGVQINGGAASNTIGGTTTSARDVISGNDWNGVDIGNSGTNDNVIEGDYIGTDVSGSQSLGNDASGVAIYDGASNNIVGGTANGAGNTISANVIYGVYISDSGTTGNAVETDLIGTDATGTHALGNATDGVIIQSGATNTTIGGTATDAGNVISANGNYGILITGTGISGTVLEHNLIGTDITGTKSLANSLSGVQIDNGGAVSVAGGLTTPAGVFHGFDFASASSVVDLALGGNLSGPPQGQTSGGTTAVYRIDMEMDGMLLAIVHPEGFTARLMILDSQGRVLVQSDGLSPSDPDSVIDQYLAGGNYTLVVESTGGAGSYALTTMLTPAESPFLPIPVVNGGRRHRVG